MVDLVDVGGESCEPVAGLVNEVLIADHAGFTLINDPAELCGDSEATSVEELVTISEDHTFTAGKGFTKILGIEENNGLTITMIGGKGRRLFQNTLTVVVSGSNASLLGFLRRVKNGKFIVLAEEFGNGNMRQIGSKRLAATFEGIEAALEAVIEGNNSVTLTIQDKSKWPAAIYTGAITMKPASS